MHRTPALVALVLVVAAVAPASVAAQQTDPLDGLLVEDDDGGVDVSASLVRAAQGIAGVVEGRTAAAQSFVSGVLGTREPVDPDQEVADIQSFVNERSSEFVEYANGRLDPSDEHDVVEIEYTIDGETASHVVVGTHNDTEWTGVEVVNSTDKTIDETCTLSGDAARNASEELERLYNEFIKPDETPTPRAIGRLTGRYNNDVECSFL